MTSINDEKGTLDQMDDADVKIGLNEAIKEMTKEMTGE